MIHGHGDDLYNYTGIRLNFSSNIPSCAPHLEALEEHLRRRISVIRSYPEPAPRSLEEKIAHSIGLNPSEVLVTSGATEAIYLIAQAAPLLCPPREGHRVPTYTVVHPTFSEYDSACQMFGLEARPDGDLCWLCNPNNPTGEVMGEDFIHDLARRHRLLVIDQSYEDYTLKHAETSPTLRGEGGERIRLHSLTKKYCIPGLRLGYVTAPSPVIGQLRRCCRPWSVNALAIEAGLWLTDQPLPDNRPWLAEAQRLRKRLNQIPGIHARETQTNFLLCTIEGHTAAELKEYLARRRGILIRDASNFPGLSPHHFRVAAQRPEENDELVDAITVNFEL